jgi:hypothetical protein
LAAEHTGADSVRAYLTGAAADGDWQPSPAASLGGYRSAVAVESLTVLRDNPIAGIAILYVSGANGEGVGALTAVSANELRWTPPGDTQGASVTIVRGETQQIPGNDPDKYVIVTRFTASDLAGTETVQLLDTYNNVIGGRDFTTAENTAGEALYDGTLMLRNGGAVTAEGVTVWIESGYETGIQIAKEAPVASALEVLSNDADQPTGLAWVAPTSEGAGLVIGDLAAGALYGLHIERSVTADQDPNARIKVVLNYSFTVSGTKYTGQWRGQYRVPNAGWVGYVMFVGQDAEPDPLVDAPAASGAALPLSAAGYALGHKYYVATVPRNAYGLVAPVEEWEVYNLTAGGVDLGVRPSAPSAVTGAAAANGELRLQGLYDPAQDTETTRATDWVIYRTTDGTAPDPTVDTPAIQAMRMDGGPELLDWTSTDTPIDQTPFQWLVRTRRLAVKSVQGIARSDTTATVYCARHGFSTGDSVTIAGADQAAYNGAQTITVVDDASFTFTVAGNPATPATGTITATKGVSVESDNTTAGTTTGSYDGPARPQGRIAFGRAAGLATAPPSFGSDVDTVIDAGASVKWVQKAGETQLWAGATLLFNVQYNSVDQSRNGFYTTFQRREATVSGAAAAVSEYAAGPPALVHVSVNGTRRLKVDVTNTDIYVGPRQQKWALTDPSSRQAAPAHPRYADTCIQVWDPGVCDWVTAVRILSTGAVEMIVPWKQRATQAECL